MFKEQTFSKKVLKTQSWYSQQYEMQFVLKKTFFFLLSGIKILTIPSLKTDSLVILHAVLHYYLPVRMALLTWKRPLLFPNVMTMENVSVNTNVNLLPLSIRIYHTMYLVYT